MRLLAIDPGLEKVGYAVLERKTESFKDSLQLISSGCIKTKRTEPTQIRLLHVFNTLNSLILRHKPSFILVELVYFFKNQKTVINIARAQGIIFLLAAQHALNISFLTPLQIKEFLTGYGKADKSSIKKMISILLHIDVSKKEDDETDAIACGLAYCYLNKNLLK